MYFGYTLFYDFVYPKYTKCAWGNSKAATDALSAAAFYTGFYRYVGRLLHAQQLAHLSCVVRCHVALDNLHAAVNMHMSQTPNPPDLGVFLVKMYAKSMRVYNGMFCSNAQREG